MDEEKVVIDHTLNGRYKQQYTTDIDAHNDAIIDYDSYEAMGLSKVWDSVSRTTKNSITDSTAATIVRERSARVVGQLPTGVMRAFGKKDTAKSMLMDLIRLKYVYPNANAQHPFLDKIYLWEKGAGQYGDMPMFYDWHVSPNGYVGPDCWIWNPRNFIPQNGYTSVADMDYAHSIAYVGPSFFKDLLEDDSDDGGWDREAIRKAMESFRNSKKSHDTQRDTVKQRTQSSQDQNKIMLVTRHEAGKKGKWVSFLPEYSFLTVRSIDNPHKNGRIPFVILRVDPSFDSYYSVGDFQRLKPLQFAKDGLTNYYFEGIKTNLRPVMVVNANGVVKHTVSTDPNSVIQETVNGSVRYLSTSTAGLSTYQSAMSQMQASMLNVSGSTDTAVNAEQALDPGFGKTPQALQMRDQRENTNDNQVRRFLEQAMEQLIDGMMSLIPAVGTESIDIDMFSEELQEMLDISDSGQSAKLRVKPKELKGIDYKFSIDFGSTKKADESEKAAGVLEMLDTLSRYTNVFTETGQQPPNLQPLVRKYVQYKGIDVDMAELFPPEQAQQMQAQEEPPVEEPMPPEEQVPPDEMMQQPAMQIPDLNELDIQDPELRAQAEKIIADVMGGQQSEPAY
jgi:hypothetical protein